jgi:hypothetical protein
VGGFQPEASMAEAALAPAQVELWVESNGTPTAPELTEASQEATTALDDALSRYKVGDSFGPVTLYARERGLTRTSARRREQVAATVGLIVGLAAIVAVAVIALSSGGHGHGHGVPSHAPSGGSVVAPAVHPVAGIPAAHLPHLGHAGLGPAGLGHHWGRRHVHLDPWPDLWLSPEPWNRPDYPGAMVVEEDVPPPPEEVATAPAPKLPEMPALQLGNRGTFDGDRTLLQLDLVDRSSGALLWTKTVEHDRDPRDRDDVARLVSLALRGQGWARLHR